MSDLLERLRADDLLEADMVFLVEDAADEIERLSTESRRYRDALIHITTMDAGAIRHIADTALDSKHHPDCGGTDCDERCE